MRYIIDNDGTNLFLRSPLSDLDLKWAAEQCPDSVTTYMICPNCIGKFMYPCSVGELISRDVAPYLVDAIDRGEDLFGRFLDYLRQKNKEVFITYRMNDVHNANDPDHWGASNFKKEHPELAVDFDAIKDGRADWMSYCLDYSRQEVQGYILSSLTDLVSKYDIDGFQLDWMRFPRHLSGESQDEVWEKRLYLTQFMRSFREVLDEVGASRGKKIMLSARIPTWLDGCKHVGIDIAEWGRQKLVDFITLAPFLSSDFVIPIEDFRKIIPGCPIYAGTDMNHSGRAHTAESYRAWALSMYGQGADGPNLFNFPCWTEYLGEQPYDWIADLNDPEKIRRKPALYTIISNHHRITRVDQPAFLPRSLESGSSTEFSLLLPESAIPASRAMLLIAAIGDYSVSINGVKLSNPRKASSGNIFLMFTDQDTLNREPKPENCLAFMFPADILKPKENIISFGNDGSLNIQRIDMGLWY